MKRRISLLLIGSLILINSALKADEGMWLLPLLNQLNIKQMKQEGLKLSAEDIYSINSSSLKDAIVIFGRGCTGEVISEQGLILTNHHCGYPAIQKHSAPEHDYLKDGFWAKTLEEEIPTPGLSVTFLVRLEDVTDKVNSVLNPQMSESDRDKAIEKVSKEIENKAKEGNSYSTLVRNYYGGNQFYLLVYEVFNDVRMVGAPPSSIGKFGADTDNWMWPRHTCDFSMFRVYAGKDNKPAEYSKENVPYKPKKALTISLKGVKKDDFTMILGYPGRTQRYMTSMELESLIKITNTNRIYIRGIKQDILLKDMLADRSINIKYASKYSSSSNYWKNSIGQNKALKRLKIYDKKVKEEQKFTEWVNADPARKAKYGECLGLIKEGVDGTKDYLHVIQYISETLNRGGMELISFAGTYDNLNSHIIANQGDSIAKDIRALKRKAKAFYKDYSASTDRKVAKAMFRIFSENVDKKYQPDIFQTIESKYSNNFDVYVDQMFDNSIFADSVKLNNFLAKPEANILDNDLAFIAAKSVNGKNAEILKLQEPALAKLTKGKRLYIAGILEMNQGKAMYPDANSTMRLTYGQVKDYYPMDAVHYDFLTTLDGVMEKEDPDNWEFVVPAKLKELYNSKDYGRYGVNGKMPVAFITTNDITGGNSGSPVMNANGELIGTAFDGNWEAMSGDIVFENQLQRCINVDVRYTLFIVDKFAGATRLIKEMKIIE